MGPTPAKQRGELRTGEVIQKRNEPQRHRVHREKANTEKDKKKSFDRITGSTRWIFDPISSCYPVFLSAFCLSLCLCG